MDKNMYIAMWITLISVLMLSIGSVVQKVDMISKQKHTVQNISRICDKVGLKYETTTNWLGIVNDIKVK